jgi:hypothetical protein
MDCIDKLRYESAHPKKTADAILEFLSPIPLRDSRDESLIKTKVLELCEEAFRLKLMMRKSKEGYQCEVPDTEGGPCLLVPNHESLVEPMAVEGGKPSQAGNEIAYTLFAALTKQGASSSSSSSSGDKRRLVLEKAHVILKRK